MMTVAPNPCASCPYARSTPPGVWDASEYEKLRGYDADPCLLPPFQCHETAGLETIAVCKGWLIVHRESVSVRLACAEKRLRAADIPEDGDPSLYSSGNEAADAGLRGVARPTRKARATIAKIHVRRERRRR
jgi:hypothetical protein